MSAEDLSRFEDALQQVPGVKSARVVGDDRPSEIHVIATRDRPPKQVVRDVQSLATAGFGLSIDHRIVSVVQLDQPTTEPAQKTPPMPKPPAAPAMPDVVQRDVAISEAVGAEGEARRPLVERVVVANEGRGGSVTVALRWPDGQVTEGTGAAGTTRETRAQGATVAVMNALEPVLAPMRARVDVQHVAIHHIGSTDSVLVRAVFYERGAAIPVVGSALVYDDVATASVHAVLHALNRKLQPR